MSQRRVVSPANAVLIFSFLSSAAHLFAQSTAVSSVAPPSTVFEREPLGLKPEPDQTKPLVDWLPIWGRDAREKGFDLPLPFGVGLTYTYIHQNMVVSDVKINGNPLDLTIRDAKTITHTGVFRTDAWIFPFLNVYALFGETSGVTKPALEFSNGEVLESSVDYNRFSYGGGLTLAGGWKSWFATLDANWTTGDIVSKEKGQVGDDPINSFTMAPRVGMLISSGRFGTGSVWIGGMYLAATSEIHDKVDLSNHPRLANLIGQDSISYSVKVEPKDNWNLLIGGNWEITKRWSITAEVGGVMDRFHTIGSVMWRF